MVESGCLISCASIRTPVEGTHFLQRVQMLCGVKRFFLQLLLLIHQGLQLLCAAAHKHIRPPGVKDQTDRGKHRDDKKRPVLAKQHLHRGFAEVTVFPDPKRPVKMIDRKKICRDAPVVAV